MADWLQELGKHRGNPRPKESETELLKHLEQLSGKTIQSRQDITDYVNGLSKQAQEKRTRFQYLKNVLLGALLIIAVLQYYFIDVQLQILSQATITVFVPVKEEPQPARRI